MFIKKLAKQDDKVAEGIVWFAQIDCKKIVLRQFIGEPLNVD